jgi:hypothetical protein
MAKWKSSLWNEPIKNAIHWYVESNIGAGGVEGALVLIQAALELLSWLYLVEDPTTAKCSTSKFNPKSAEVKIRELLCALGIPAAIPARFGVLCGIATTRNISDGPDAIVTLRNGIVHPKKARRDVIQQTPALARVEAWELGLWYLEMALLRLVGYGGKYSPRHTNGWAGAVETKVPWA